jgi:hypothetical protein
MFMSKNKDVVNILILVIIGMFIPFLGTLIISFQVNILSFDGFMKIISTFITFLVIFGVELGIVYLYFYVSNQFAEKKLSKTKKK